MTADDAPWTIDELAREAGVTVRTIRDHNTRGLLAPPVVRGRTGYYGREHLARLKLIREMQADGFNLTAIRRILERSPADSATILSFREELRAPFEHEDPIVMSDQELVDAFGGERVEPAFREAERLGLIVPIGEGRYEVPSPSLIRAGEQAVALGVPLLATLELIAALKRSADTAARAYVNLFLEHVWRPHDDAGQPGDRWPALRDALTQLRPLAAQTMLGVFEQSMSTEVDAAIKREQKREQKRLNAPPKKRRKR